MAQEEAARASSLLSALGEDCKLVHVKLGCFFDRMHSSHASTRGLTVARSALDDSLLELGLHRTVRQAYDTGGTV